jgi:hypothetical protein
MSEIREQIMALKLIADVHDGDVERSYIKHHNKQITKAANLAEARERELLEQIEAIKSCADAYEFDAECRKVLLDKAKAGRAQMIAELRGLLIPDNFTYQTLIHTSHIEAVINKYEEN